MLKVILNFIFLVFLIFSARTWADCFDTVKFKAAHIQEALDSDYQRLDGPQARVSKAKSPVLLKGTNGKAVLVQHGFMATPFEVEAIGKTLNQAGYTVYMPLIAGFGSTAKVANIFTRQTWKEYFAINVSILKECYNDISLVGFSTGGTLVYDYLASHPTENQVRSAVLLSPFFGMHSSFAAWLSNLNIKVPSSMNVHKISPSLLPNDLMAIVKNPEGYNSEIPMQAGREVVAFGNELYNHTLSFSVSQPSLIIYSEYDGTISQNAAVKMAIRNFSRPTIEVFPYASHIPHQMAVPNVSPKSDMLARRVLRFIESKY